MTFEFDTKEHVARILYFQRVGINERCVALKQNDAKRTVGEKTIAGGGVSAVEKGSLNREKYP